MFNLILGTLPIIKYSVWSLSSVKSASQTAVHDNVNYLNII